MPMQVTTKVRLPSWIFQQADGNKQELQRLIVEYMKRYPEYRILKVQGKFAVCISN